MANHSCIFAVKTPWTSEKGKKIWHKDEPPRLEGIQYVMWKSGGQPLIVPKRMKQWGQKGNDAQLWVSGDERKTQCWKEEYCIGTWNVRSTNQGKLDVVKQEMAKVNTDILGISELKWMGMGEFNSDDHYIYYCGQESCRRNGVVLIINKSQKFSTWVQHQKWQNDFCSFPRQTTQHHSNPSLCPNHWHWRSWTVLWRPTRPSRTNAQKDVLFIT